jgi:mechanosensitive ion channel-like protein
MIPMPVRDWGDALFTSMTQALALFLAAIPKVLAFVVIVIVGWIVAALVARAVESLLRRVRFNDMAARSGFGGFVANTGVETDSAGFIALIAKWFIRLITLVVAFDALGLPAVSDVLRQLLLWLPNLVVAVAVLIIGGLAANALAGLIRGATAKADLGNPHLLANIARVAVWAFAIIVAVNQIGIARELINTLFMATVGAVALAVGLAFGLGGRETAAELWRDWYERSRRAAPKMEHAANEMARDADDARRRH